MIEPGFGDAEKGVLGVQGVEQRELRDGLLRDADVIERGAEVHEHHVGARADERKHRAPSATTRRRQRGELSLGLPFRRRDVRTLERAERRAVPREDLMKDVPAFGRLGWMGRCLCHSGNIARNSA